MSSRFPTPLALDPWWDLYLPALYGEHAIVDTALADVGDDPSVGAVVVRTLAVLGRTHGAHVVWARIADAAVPEVDSLAVVLGRDADAAVRRLSGPGADPGRAADAGCDRAARALVEGDRARAQDAIGAVLEGPLDHAEAARWARFLADCPDPVAVFRGAVADRLEGDRPFHRDAQALAVRARCGWVSAVRLARRVIGAPHLAPRPGSGLAALAGAGVAAGNFAGAPELNRAPADDPRVELEVLADLVTSLVDEGRDASGLLAHLWERAWGVGPAAGHDVARIAVGLANRDLRLAPVGLRAARLLAASGVGDVTAWRAYEAAFLGVDARDEAIGAALVIAGDPTSGDEAWRVALDVLRRHGHERDARGLAESALGRHDRAWTAGIFLGRPFALSEAGARPGAPSPIRAEPGRAVRGATSVVHRGR